jgi:hypothetical protein
MSENLKALLTAVVCHMLAHKLGGRPDAVKLLRAIAQQQGEPLGLCESLGFYDAAAASENRRRNVEVARKALIRLGLVRDGDEPLVVRDLGKNYRDYVAVDFRIDWLGGSRAVVEVQDHEVVRVVIEKV